ncbi:ABC-F type ribosomal protection protein [Paenibacillus mesophilus]|uniref:ribosomal protection-like ABC-F family protein n=1 Tax=Paenibacillus mesophilus TaxID=2582849 RepID=UPI00110F40AF|nr:ABC-F type ribosomal protection protein [Paenibacillus mesophilus]TMV46901.1 ABC-F type ribosomal protection protein [Paenibacillus mesophilus]
MLRLEANQIERRIGDRLLFRIEGTLRIYEDERVGLVGVNGAGKSTLLSVLAGLEDPDAGAAARHGTAAVVAQFDDPGRQRSGRVTAPEDPVPLEYGTMSGGERTRWRWEQALRKRAVILFADEPTSHLDGDKAAEVEEELRKYEGTVMLISHDRALLDAVCTRILELDEGVLREYPGNFSEYLRLKELRREREWFEYDQYAKEKKRLTMAAIEKAGQARSMKKKPTGKVDSEARLGKDQFNRRKSKVEKTVQSIQKRIDQLEVKEKPKNREQPVFDIRYHAQIHAKEAIRLERLERSFGSRQLFLPLSCSIAPGMRVGIVGANGSGKTTLLRAIMEAESGVRLAAGCKIGYFDQRLDVLRDDRTVLEQVAETSEYPEAAVRTALARMLMKRDDVFKPASVLSGGEKVKAVLAKLFMADHNVLLLDEPTNYLDIFAREKLAQVLKEYPGTILFCSHDRHFLSELATHLLVIENGRWTFEYGGYAEYRERKRKRDSINPAGSGKLSDDSVPPATSPNPGPDTDSISMTHAERENEIMRIEMELVGLLGRLSAPGKNDAKEELDKQYKQLTGRLKQLKGQRAAN